LKERNWNESNELLVYIQKSQLDTRKGNPFKRFLAQVSSKKIKQIKLILKTIVQTISDIKTSP